MGVGPLLAGLPVRLDVLAELLAGLNLSAQYVGLRGRHVARARLAANDTYDAEVRPMPGAGPVGARTARFVATQVLHRESPPAHRLGVGELASEVQNGGRDVVGIRHSFSFALL